MVLDEISKFAIFLEHKNLGMYLLRVFLFSAI